METQQSPPIINGHPSTQHSALSPQHSDEPGELAAVGALLLVAALVASIFWAMSDRTSQDRYAAREARTMLADGRYSEAVALYERTLPTYDRPDVRLGLSYAYLARRDGER